MKTIVKSIFVTGVLLTSGLLPGCGAINNLSDSINKAVAAADATSTSTSTDTDTAISTDANVAADGVIESNSSTDWNTTNGVKTTTVQNSSYSSETTVSGTPIVQGTGSSSMGGEVNPLIGTWASSCDDGIVFTRVFTATVETVITSVFQDQDCTIPGQTFTQQLAYSVDGSNIDFNPIGKQPAQTGNQAEPQIFNVTGNNDVLVFGNNNQVDSNSRPTGFNEDQQFTRVSQQH